MKDAPIQAEKAKKAQAQDAWDRINGQAEATTYTDVHRRRIMRGPGTPGGGQ
jgi:hypothetical protein